MTDHVHTTTAGAVTRRLDRLVAAARNRPGQTLAWVLAIHLIAWTLASFVAGHNLQLDHVDLLSVGREWQLGYWKHPPLPWWLAELARGLTGHVESIHLLGPLSAVLCFYGVWLLARELVGDVKALIAVVALQGLHFYNYSVVKFAHDQLQLPFWAFAALFFWRAIVRGRLFDWTLAGLFLAAAFWSKYAAFVLAATLGFILLLDPTARRAWRTPGPYVMAAAFALAIAPNAWWLLTNDFLPLRYVEGRAAAAAHWYEYLLFPLQWSLSQAGFLLPMAGLLALLYWPPPPLRRERADAAQAFNRRYAVALAFGPFAVTTAVVAATGRQPVALWGYPLWSFVPLAVLMLWPPTLAAAPMRRFAGAVLVLMVALPLAYVAADVIEPLLRDRAKATQFPGRLLADTITRTWRERTGTPLRYVGGAIVMARGGGPPRELRALGLFAANNVAVYSPDRPRVIVHGELRYSPWIDPWDLERHGAVLIWQPVAATPELPENIRRAFPRAELQPRLRLPRMTPRARGHLVVDYAIIPPNP
ncbi:MAG: glycosyltransferase family 39 protein [Hyphomicrobiales bacterium]|nr:glycosyltransferase family 39 protein [Hyphomicrobiales bacterium]